MSGSKVVITYQIGPHYGSCTASLCEACEAADRHPFALGPVSHGKHWGFCDWCQRDRD